MQRADGLNPALGYGVVAELTSGHSVLVFNLRFSRPELCHKDSAYTRYL